MQIGSWLVLAIVALFVLVPCEFSVLCACAVLCPRMIWFLSEGWRFRGAEPTGCALVATRVGGLVLLAMGPPC